MSKPILPARDPVHQANFRNLYLDIFWFGVLAGSTMAFLAVYAARLGASNFQIGLLSAGPAAVNLLVTLPVGRWLEGRPLIRTSFRSSVYHRLGYLALVALPWMFGETAQVWGMVWITLVMSIPGTLLAIAFNAMYADVVPPEWRAHVVGRRNALVAISVTVTSLLSGQILDRVIFPINYQIVFAIGAMGGLLSCYHLGRIRSINGPPPRVGMALGELVQPGSMQSVRRFAGLRYLLRSRGRSFLRLDVLRGSFGTFTLACLLFFTFQYLPFPIMPPYYVRILHLTDGEISLGSAIFHTMMMVASFYLGRVSARFGHRRVMVFGSILLGSYPLLIAMASDATLFWVASFLGGGVFAMLNGGMVNRLMERVPEDDRPAHMALFNLALNLGILAGSLAGPLLGDWLGLREALYLNAGLRLLAGILFLFWG